LLKIAADKPRPAMPPGDRERMAMSKGLIASGFAVLALLAGVPATAAPARNAPARNAPAGDEIVYLGQHGKELTAARFDRRTGALTLIGPVAAPGRPTWAVMHPRLPVLYVANELGNDGTLNGMVLAYRVNEKTGQLTLLSQVDAGGGGTTYLWVDGKSNTLAAANYGGGSVATFGLNRDGSIGPLASLVAGKGAGPNRKRQKSAHAHSVIVAPGGHFLLAADLGADRVFVYPFDGATHAARAGDHAHDYVAPGGSGPRHLVPSADGRFVYLIDEMGADVVTLAWDGVAGTLSEMDRQSLNGPDFKGDGSGSEILVSPDGRFLYAGNRAEGVVRVYALDKASGRPTLVQSLPTGGQVPWGLGLSPDGRWLLVAHEQSGTVRAFAVDRASGRLSDSGHEAALAHPVSVTFAAQR
jgi:6-phosphogluconolactonase